MEKGVMPQVQMTIEECFVLLELQRTDWPFNPTPEPYDIAVEKLDQFKKMLKKHRRELAKKYHPDVSDVDPEKLAKINNAYDCLMSTKITKIQVPRPTSVIFTFDAADSSTSTSTTTGGYSGYRGFHT